MGSDDDNRLGGRFYPQTPRASVRLPAKRVGTIA